MSQVQIIGLRKEYSDRRQRRRDHDNSNMDGPEKVVLDGIDLEFQEGELVCILGPSGCGKSTLLRILAGFDQATAGKVLVNGKEVSGPSSDNIFVFQHNGLLPWMTVEENVGLGLRHMQDMAAKHQKVQEYIDMTGLTGFEHYYPHQLSGGMQRRAELARAMATNPHMLIMDEPFTGLDFLTHLRMREEVVNMHMFIGKTMIVITHFVDDALVMADRVVVFSERPTQVKMNMKFDLPHPRKIGHEPGLSELRDEIFFMLGVSDAA